jgi:uncharacterized protein (DUF58 family)
LPVTNAKRGRTAHAPLFDEAFLKKLEYLRVVARKVFSGHARGERRSHKVGSGLEFADYRGYAPGDDLRYLDWNLYARLDRLLVRLVQEEEDLTIELLLDTSRSMALPGTPAKIEHAARVAAALCYVGLGNLDRVGLQAFSDGLGPRLHPGRGKGRIFGVLDFISGLAPGGPTRMAEALGAFARRGAAPRRRGAIAVILSDFWDPGYAEGMDLLRYHGFEPYAVQVVDPGERRPPLRGDMDLVDCESGEVRSATVSTRLLAAHERAYHRWLADVETSCRARQVPLVRAPTDVPFEDLVLRVLRAGGIVR